MPNQPQFVDRRVAALDGLRALAVVLVMAYHGGIPGLRVAGFFGVDIFFVLSGFLITRLLLVEQADRGHIRFAAFWGRRARRLLPGLLVMLVAVQAYVTYAAPAGRYPGFRGDALSVVAYGSNWHFIQESSNYFASTGAPSLLTHTWSLAIEEQFYLVWPLLVLGAAYVARRLRRNPASVVLAVSAVGSLASAGWMAALYRSGTNTSRLYCGTDTHAQSILVGCALAALVTLIPIRLNRQVAMPMAVVMAAGLGWAVCSLGTSDSLTYQGGFLAVSLLTAGLIAVVVTGPSSPASRTLSLPPLVYIGRISYGMYLWYFPLFAVIDRANTGLSGPDLFLTRCSADVLLAALSFHLIEQRVRGWRPRPRQWLPAGAAALTAGAAAALFVGAVVLIGSPTSNPIGPSALAMASAAQAPPAAGEPGTRILVFGDSTGATLGDDLALSPAAEQHRIALDVVGVFGCGLAVSAAYSPHGQASSPPVACRSGAPPARQWPALLRSAIDTFHPAVVLIVAGRWEVVSRQAKPGGPWINITQPVDAMYVRSQLETAASIALGRGASVDLATAPCFSSGEQANGDSWPEDSVSRLNAYNSMVRQVVAGEATVHPGSASIVNLDSMVCPGGEFHSMIGGVTVRAPDGIHYPFFDLKNMNDANPDTVSEARAFGAWIEPKIFG